MGVPKYDDFTRLVARQLDVTPATAKKYVEAIVEVIGRELYLSDQCEIYNLGRFYNKVVKEYKQMHTDKDGNVIEYTVPEHVRPSFTPHDTFINDVNLKGVTGAYRSRVKRKQLTKRDLDRIAKAEAIERLRRVSEEDGLRARMNFIDLLKDKRAQHEADSAADDD